VIHPCWIKRRIPMANFGWTVRDSTMVTMESLLETNIALSNGTIDAPTTSRSPWIEWRYFRFNQIQDGGCHLGKLQRHRAVSLRQHGLLVLLSYKHLDRSLYQKCLSELCNKLNCVRWEVDTPKRMRNQSWQKRKQSTRTYCCLTNILRST